MGCSRRAASCGAGRQCASSGAERRRGAGYAAVSDVGGPYAAMPPEAPAALWLRTHAAAADRGLYRAARQRFFAVGIPQPARPVYTIAVIDRGGGDGRLVIDARDGRIVRFVPARGIGAVRRRCEGALWRRRAHCRRRPSSRAAPRPPAPIPHVASRAVPVPKPSPLAARPAPKAAPRSCARTGAASARAAGRCRPTEAGEAQATAQAAAPTRPSASGGNSGRVSHSADAGNAEGAGAAQ